MAAPRKQSRLGALADSMGKAWRRVHAATHNWAHNPEVDDAEDEVVIMLAGAKLEMERRLNVEVVDAFARVVAFPESDNDLLNSARDTDEFVVAHKGGDFIELALKAESEDPSRKERVLDEAEESKGDYVRPKVKAVPLLTTRTVAGEQAGWSWQWKFSESFTIPKSAKAIGVQLYADLQFEGRICIGRLRIGMDHIHQLHENSPASALEEVGFHMRQAKSAELGLGPTSTSLFLARADNTTTQSSVRTSVGALRVVVYEARSVGVKRSCYVVAEFEDSVRKTSVYEEVGSPEDPVWNDMLHFDSVLDPSSDLKIKVVEHQHFRNHTVHGSIVIPLSSLVLRPWLPNPRHHANPNSDLRQMAKQDGKSGAIRLRSEHPKFDGALGGRVAATPGDGGRASEESARESDVWGGPSLGLCSPASQNGSVESRLRLSTVSRTSTDSSPPAATPRQKLDDLIHSRPDHQHDHHHHQEHDAGGRQGLPSLLNWVLPRANGAGRKRRPGTAVLEGWFHLYPDIQGTIFNRDGQYRAVVPGTRYPGFGLPRGEHLGFIRLKVELTLTAPLPYVYLRRPPLVSHELEAEPDESDELDFGMLCYAAFKKAFIRLEKLMKKKPNWYLFVQQACCWRCHPGFSATLLAFHFYITLKASLHELPVVVCALIIFLSYYGAKHAVKEPVDIWEKPRGDGESQGGIQQRFKKFLRSSLRLQALANRLASTIEKLGNILNWTDPMLTAVVFLVMAALAVAASLFLYLVNVRHFAFAVGLRYFVPKHKEDALRSFKLALRDAVRALSVDFVRREKTLKAAIKKGAQRLIRNTRQENRSGPEPALVEEAERSRTRAFAESILMYPVFKEQPKHFKRHEISGMLYCYRFGRRGFLASSELQLIMHELQLTRGGIDGAVFEYLRLSEFDRRWCEAWNRPRCLRGTRIGSKPDLIDSYVLRLEKAAVEDLGFVRTIRPEKGRRRPSSLAEQAGHLSGPVFRPRGREPRSASYDESMQIRPSEVSDDLSALLNGSAASVAPAELDNLTKKPKLLRAFFGRSQASQNDFKSKFRKLDNEAPAAPKRRRRKSDSSVARAARSEPSPAGGVSGAISRLRIATSANGQRRKRRPSQHRLPETLHLFAVCFPLHLVKADASNLILARQAGRGPTALEVAFPELEDEPEDVSSDFDMSLNMSFMERSRQAQGEDLRGDIQAEQKSAGVEHRTSSPLPRSRSEPVELRRSSSSSSSSSGRESTGRDVLREASDEKPADGEVLCVILATNTFGEKTAWMNAIRKLGDRKAFLWLDEYFRRRGRSSATPGSAASPTAGVPATRSEQLDGRNLGRSAEKDGEAAGKEAVVPKRQRQKQKGRPVLRRRFSEVVLSDDDNDSDHDGNDGRHGGEGPKRGFFSSVLKTIKAITAFKTISKVMKMVYSAMKLRFKCILRNLWERAPDALDVEHRIIAGSARIPLQGDGVRLPVQPWSSPPSQKPGRRNRQQVQLSAAMQISSLQVVVVQARGIPRGQNFVKISFHQRNVHGGKGLVKTTAAAESSTWNEQVTFGNLLSTAGDLSISIYRQMKESDQNQSQPATPSAASEEDSEKLLAGPVLIPVDYQTFAEMQDSWYTLDPAEDGSESGLWARSFSSPSIRVQIHMT